MSVTLKLRSAALAQLDAATLAAHAQARPGVVTVRTRMRHRDLLARALTGLRAQVTDDGTSVVAAWEGRRITFGYGPEGVQVAHVDGPGLVPAEASRLVLSVDEAYAAEVQRAVLARLKDRAAQVGMRVEAERVNADQSISVTLAATS
ncbi:hypothetical protein AMES_8372 [Amycolatopsis mediterranei S699]|uniref:DUF1257 domain-containing protein n=2 Tax=Amycolatopsis mediterranei TaxID=33910 RepID=A0A0H3DJ15_AMYMU|nr:hypothetical protein [Amycolatopsis mediterranei]ADJ50197.1 conserved hypothetical protein [Amycolatopsis mediterranei U32]AEK47194.1 hypothetical protein RAM_43635 [Amycolatopsis mediterranei S699]AFO81905.1 hypothetical protein AMES_8372 [Amycolatopsis mediterranei S699]AGT89034.1 hypothetical protein B737_8373 [Amycolatopsis mediterranei RB]KDO07554.1 hypothetical protein DV26_25020 [Amycolatopsis mediterranei]